MTFLETQFPPNISAGSAGGPEYKTLVVASQSGAEQRIQLWPRGRLRYDVSKGVQSPAEWAQLIAFYRSCGGRALGFRFKDWADYTASLEPIANPGGTTLQLIKTYTVAGSSEVRTILKPISGTSPTWLTAGIHLYENGVLMTSGYTVDYTTGIVTLTTAAPTATFSWSGEFDVPARFDVDGMKMVGQIGYMNWDSVAVVELPTGG